MIPEEDRKKLTKKTLADLQRIRACASGNWQYELFLLTKRVGELNFHIGRSREVNTKRYEDIRQDIAEHLSNIIINAAFLAIDYEIDLDKTIPEALYELVMSTVDTRDECMDILEGGKKKRPRKRS